MLGIGTIAKKVFGTPNDRKIKATRPLVDQINALEPDFEKLTDAGIKDKTEELAKRALSGESLDNLLPEAFANCREAARRTLGLRAFDTQLMAAIFLHQGNISEQKTGEGKTLTAALAAYLNALSGKGVHVVTVNEYLVKRDADWMGKVFNASRASRTVSRPGRKPRPVPSPSRCSRRRAPSCPCQTIPVHHHRDRRGRSTSHVRVRQNRHLHPVAS